jgi:hypothetical protein
VTSGLILYTLYITLLFVCMHMRVCVQYMNMCPPDCGALLCVIMKPRELGGHSPRWAAEPEKIINK